MFIHSRGVRCSADSLRPTRKAFPVATVAISPTETNERPADTASHCGIDENAYDSIEWGFQVTVGYLEWHPKRPPQEVLERWSEANGLRSVYLDGLYGVHSLGFEFDPKSTDFEDRIRILIGPNGCGKSTLLRLLDAYGARRYAEIVQTPFESLSLGFIDGTTVVFEGQDGVVVRSDGAKWQAQLKRDVVPISRNPGRPDLLLFWDALSRGASGPDAVELKVSSEPSGASLRATIRDIEDDLRQWSSHLDRQFQLPALRVHLIDVSRLQPHHSDTGLGTSITKFPEQLKTIIQEHKSRSLDRVGGADAVSFQRALDGLLGGTGDGSELSPDEVFGKVVRLRAEADRRVRLGLLPAGQDPMPLRDSDFEAAVDLYNQSRPEPLQLIDLATETALEKQEYLRDLADKVEVLLDLVNGFFRGKRLEIGAGELMQVRDTHTDRAIALDSLSSGEKHLLTLVFSLLFEVHEPEALILIDEPELSLHVAWQRDFIAALSQVSQFERHSFVLATHAPAIVASWMQQVVFLDAESTDPDLEDDDEDGE